MNNSHLTTICFLAILSLSLSDNSFCQESGVEAARQIIGESGIGKSEIAHGIPPDCIDSFCAGIAKIEADSNVRVTYPNMSDWRKNLFRQLIKEWIELYPSEEHYQTETILKAHGVQRLSAIARLYIVPKLEIDISKVNESISQLKEIKAVFQEGVNKKTSAVSVALLQKYPMLGESFSLDVIDDLLPNYVPILEDDINPHMKYPVDKRRFDDVRRQINSIVENAEIDLPSVDDWDIAELLQMKNGDRIEEADDFIRSLTAGLMRDVRNQFSSSIRRQCSDLIERTYSDVMPTGVVNNYRRFANDIESLFDTSIVRTAFEERRKITQEQLQKRHDERKAAWGMVVASQPRGEQIPDYELPEINRNRLLTFIIVNGIIVAAFAILAYLRWRNVRKHSKLKD